MKTQADCPYLLFESHRVPKPVLFLDYDGTLVKIFPDPELAVADDDLKNLIGELDRRFEMYLVTGRALEDIRNLIGIRVNIIALHGAVGIIGGKYRVFVEDFERYVDLCNLLEKESLIMTERYPGLRIYNKRGNLLYHYGRVSPSLLDGLFGEVREIGRVHGLSVYMGKLIIELRIPGMDKGKTITFLRNGRNSIIAGDDTTDEEAFSSNPDAVKISVGRALAGSDCVLSDPAEMRRFLRYIIQREE